MKNLKANWITKTKETRLYQIPVPVIGLTGGIATGKSTVARMFEKINIPIIDADKLVKNVYRQEKTKTFVRQNFPEAFIENEINFTKLREIVFNDEEKKKQIEHFIYAELPQEFARMYSTFKNPSLVIYDVPLLFEKHLDSFVDVSICVYAKPDIQVNRIVQRDKCDQELARKILDQQMSIEDKKNKSNLIIENNLDIANLEENFKQLISQLFD